MRGCLALAAGGGDSCRLRWSSGFEGGNPGVESSVESFECDLHEGKEEMEEMENPADAFINIVVFGNEGGRVDLFKQFLIIIAGG